MWRDLICSDLKMVGVQEIDWYKQARRSRAGWRASYSARHAGRCHPGRCHSSGPTTSQREKSISSEVLGMWKGVQEREKSPPLRGRMAVSWQLKLKSSVCV